MAPTLTLANKVMFPCTTVSPSSPPSYRSSVNPLKDPSATAEKEAKQQQEPCIEGLFQSTTAPQQKGGWRGLVLCRDPVLLLDTS